MGNSQSFHGRLSTVTRWPGNSTSGYIPKRIENGHLNRYLPAHGFSCSHSSCEVETAWVHWWMVDNWSEVIHTRDVIQLWKGVKRPHTTVWTDFKTTVLSEWEKTERATYLTCVHLCETSRTGKLRDKKQIRTSLVVWWIGICQPVQGTQVRSLIWEDPTCLRVTKHARHNCWTCSPPLEKGIPSTTKSE